MRDVQQRALRQPPDMFNAWLDVLQPSGKPLRAVYEDWLERRIPQVPEPPIVQARVLTDRQRRLIAARPGLDPANRRTPNVQARTPQPRREQSGPER